MLTAVIFAPLIGGLLLMSVKKEHAGFIKIFAVVVSLVPLGVLIYLCSGFGLNVSGFQFQEIMPWIPSLGIKYHLGVDGISLPLLVLTAVLSTLSLLFSWNIREKVKEYFILFLVLETGMLGVFSALDLFLFYMFWEISLLPMYFLIGIWGGSRKEYAAVKFFLYTFLGSLAMLLSILILYFNSVPRSFDLLELSKIASPQLSALAFAGFFLAFAVKVPMFPFHTWLPDAHVEAPTAGSVILAGVLLKMGGYGFLRFLLPLFPQTCAYFSSPIVILALISIVYGAFVSFAQTDLKKLIAYSSVNHMGYVMLGIGAAMALPAAAGAARATAVSGAVLQMISHGLITGGLFFLVGMIYERTHTRQIEEFGGLGARVPVFAGIFSVFALASIGLPGLSGFISEFLIFIGSFRIYPLFTLTAFAGIIIITILFLIMIEKLLFGPLNMKFDLIPDLDPREIFCVSVLLVAIFLIGVYPSPLLNLMGKAVLAAIGGSTP